MSIWSTKAVAVLLAAHVGPPARRVAAEAVGPPPLPVVVVVPLRAAARDRVILIPLSLGVVGDVARRDATDSV